MLYRIWLEEEGWCVGEAQDAVAAERWILEHKVRVLLLSTSLPGASAFELLRLARHAEDPPAIVLLTQRQHKPMTRAAARLGPVATFAKTGNRQALVDLVRSKRESGDRSRHLSLPLTDMQLTD